MLARLTDAAEVGMAGPARSEVPDEGREVREMCGWDLCRGRQMLQAVRQKSPRSVTPEDLSDPSLLGAGEHGGVMVAEQHPAGQRPGGWPRASEKEGRGRLVAQVEGREYLFMFKPGQISKRPVFPTIVAAATGARAR
jgi:hypothetical protein